MSDRWAAQPRVPAFLHQLCIAHLLRELKDFEEALRCKWSEGMKALHCGAIEKKKQLTPEDYRTAPLSVTEPEKKLEEKLLRPEEASVNKKVRAFVNKPIKNKASILTFLRHEQVPPDNNASERAIRNVKVKTKVSGHFRTQEGAQRFAVLISIIDTTRKSGNDILEALMAVIYCCPE